MKTDKSRDIEKLKIDRRLPQIHIAQKQIELFIKWWNEDIRFQKTIPHSFEEGYLILDYDNEIDTSKYNEFIKMTAKLFKTTYRDIENQLIDFLNNMNHLTLYFKFIQENKIFINVYGKDTRIISNIEFEVGEDSDNENPINFDDLYNTDITNSDDILNCYNQLNLTILITSLWYIATTKNTTKYVYEQKRPVITSRKKNIVKVSDTKVISTPIYDITKIKTKKVDGLIKHRKGWTYSHAFQVHGHYRHYKDGKVIFVNSYIKGKNKEFKSQIIDLKPTQ